MWKRILYILIILILGFGLAFFVFKSEPKLNSNFENEASFLKNFPFRLGLDLSGGSHLIYKADISAVKTGEVSVSMDSLRDVIERRVNLFGVSEPVVQVQNSGFVSGEDEKLIVDLPGVTDVEKATAMIGQTPLLEFKIEAPKDTPQNAIVDKDGKVTLDTSPQFVSTELTGRYLEKATLQFDETTREPQVSLQFDDTGTKLFAQITKDNVGKMVAIYLDGAPISVPVVREEIPNGQAVISGSFTPTEGKQLVGRLNSGALPVPISLLSRQTIGASLGGNAVTAGVKATIVGFLLIALFLIFWYRLPGLIAVFALSIYVTIMLSLFKLLPVTLTAAGIAGFIISIGIAVDANILIFERLKEELRSGRTIADAVSAGFSRAWSSIRDSNISTIISATILFWFGTSLIKGFALTLGMGVLVSMFSAVMISRIFLSGFIFIGEGKVARFLFGSGISK
ncbi:MAG: Preprotein translocase subunit SecD [Candidatus Nomurabacteria bacterium GW2011_GWE1_32_28]|uniref:Protein translocase subunit SecD n=1 Tax=Candidatus Nomurabacteria bacterium GW2011_GWF1_31_48 TaxID=1618767 RepID=A0A0F9YEP8_9BACT|nr:MAG: Preprotein translocase subunit SecD [Candidatus Nomurabacteria bacterium GW2011_GWF2_30_133]KKP28248.1 MAG: Preprotein translocase subunit SecD [Candidatus Nomurabacteria bacterium GW2011_GWE2_31_40]KKP29843.1 MAG: Preprotein translocase subunit SecD [Candidatus Nomurabacteria bacterium GW2011_GWF1_31_48]KKP34584.1 MAG: Preprotein translocase subunit SecD [Candidatus Nomurabacteria bacterium GW2011_GWE1_32_28]